MSATTGAVRKTASRERSTVSLLQLLAVLFAVTGCTILQPTYESSGWRATNLSRALPGYAWARSRFVFEKRLVYLAVVGRPEFLELRLRRTDRSPIDTLWWYNPIGVDGRPQHDWNACRGVFDAASAVVAQNHWIGDWRAAAKGRRVVLQMRGDRSANFYDFADKNASDRWGVAKLPGKPLYFIALRDVQSDHFIDVCFGRENSGAIVYHTGSSGEFAQRHWLDRISLQTSATEGVDGLQEQYVHVSRAGERQLRTYLSR